MNIRLGLANELIVDPKHSFSFLIELLTERRLCANYFIFVSFNYDKSVSLVCIVLKERLDLEIEIACFIFPSYAVAIDSFD